MNTIGDRLTYVFGEKEISNYRIAKDLNIGKSTISNYLNNSTKPDSSKLDAICKYLNINKQWLLTGEGEVFDDHTEDHVITKKNQDIVTIPSEAWEVIKNQAECLKIKDKESEKQGERIDRLITLLEKKYSDSPNGDNKNKEAI